MSFPTLPDKHDEPAILTAADLLAQRRRRGAAPAFAPPETVILCYQPALLAHAIRRRRVRKAAGFYGDLYLLKQTGGRLAIAGNFGIGAPVVAVLLEDFVAFGVRQFVAVGLAGGLGHGLQAGDIVVCDQAVRDEGVSHHYLPPAPAAAAAPSLTARLAQALADAGRPYTVGPSWTTDAPYRETLREVDHYRRQGVVTVEMEAAALFAVAHYLGVAAAAAFSVADTVAGDQWRLDFDHHQAQQGLVHILEAAIQAFS